jgi:hypothetical protein
MNDRQHKRALRWIWPGLAAAALALGLIGSRAAQAQTEFSKITLLAPGAPASAWTEVEWLDPSGAWQEVAGWQGALETLDGSTTPLKQWTVYPENYGQGPFRWVVYTQMDGAVWGTSENFNLPVTDNINLRITVEQQALPSPTPSATGIVTATAVVTPTAAVTPTASATPEATSVMTGTPAATTTPMPTSGVTATAGVPVTGAALVGDSLTLPTNCFGSDCDFGVITAYLIGAPAGSSAAVQWLDPSGDWRNVEAWQAPADLEESGRQFKRWTVFPANFGQGPFRWVITQADGTVWGIGPTFNLPNSGEHLIQFLHR